VLRESMKAFQQVDPRAADVGHVARENRFLWLLAGGGEYYTALLRAPNFFDF